MWRRRWQVAGLLVATAAVLSLTLGARSDEDGAPRKRVYPRTFAAGPGKAIAERSCLICHSATLVTQQAKDSTTWEKTIRQMEKWGVKLSPAEHDSLRSYLAAHYGARTSK